MSISTTNGRISSPASREEFPKTFSGKSFADVDHIINSDGLYLYCKYWRPETEVRALVFHLHGMAEHCGRHHELAEKMKKLGIFSFSHDRIGHGESQGLKGEMKDYKIIIRDVLQHIDLIKPKYPDLPIFLYGHSMGGGAAVLTAHERPNFFRGILLSAPYIRASPDTATPFKVFLAKVVSRIAPRVIVGKLNPDFRSRNEEQNEIFLNDPLNDVDGLMAGSAIQYLAMGKELAKVIPTIDVPMFVAHSEDDQVCDIGGSKLLIELSESKDKTFKQYKGPLHMLEHELPEFTDAFHEEVLQWLRERIP